MELNGEKKTIADAAMKSMIGKDYYVMEGSGYFCKVVDVVDYETVTVVSSKGEENTVSIFDLRAI